MNLVTDRKKYFFFPMRESPPAPHTYYKLLDLVLLNILIIVTIYLPEGERKSE